MVRLLSIVILISMITLVFAENPGFVAVIKKPIIDKAKEKYFKSILEVIGRQTIPDFHDGDLRITNIQVWIENDKPEHMNIGFTPVLKEASLSLRDSQLKVQANWKYSKLLVDVTGSVDMKGEFTSFGLDFLMDKTGDKGLYIPQLRINNFNMELDENKFNIKIHWSGCAAPIEATVTALLESVLVAKVKGEIRDQLPRMSQSMGNEILKKMYPKFLDLYENIGIATATTSEIIIEENGFAVPIDGTIYPFNEEFVRSENTEEMPSYDPEDTGEVILQFNPYIVNTLSKTITSKGFSYSGRTLGIGYKITLDPKRGQTQIYFEEDDLHLELYPRIVTKILHWGVQFGADVKLDPQISKGDNKNMMTIFPQIEKLRLKSLKLVIFGIPFDASWLTFWINPILRFSLNWLVIPSIKVPHLDSLPLRVADSFIEFHKDRSEVGITIDL